MNPTTVDWSGAAWWWPAGLIPAPHQYADFALDLDLAQAPRLAWIALSSGTWYTLWVDGAWIEHGPTREVAPWQYYDVLDLRPYLRAGRNRLRIRAHHLGLRTHWHEPCQAGLLVRGMVLEGTTEHDLGKRTSWRAAHDASHLPTPALRHFCHGWGEHVDLGRDPQAWLHADADPGWAAPEVIAAHPLPGRGNLLPEPAPRRTGMTLAGRRLHVRDGLQVWDLGEETYGFLTIALCAPTPMSVDLLAGSLLVDGLPDHRFAGGDFRERLELPAAPRRWESFDKISVRYLALPEVVEVGSVSLREHHQPLLEVWRSAPSARTLAHLDHAIIAAAARTVTLYSDDLIADPRRERSQYNDQSVYMVAYQRLFGTLAPIRRWLLQYLRGADERGVLRMCYPSPRGGLVIPDFSISFARVLVDYLALSEDLDTVRLAFPAALAAVEAFDRHADADGLLCEVPGWTFLCNSFELARFPRSAGLNALWAESFARLGDLAERLGDERAEAFRARAAGLRTAWRRVFLRDGRILDADASPAHEAIPWWNYHHDAHCAGFRHQEGDGVFSLDLPWSGVAGTLHLAAHGRVRVLADGSPLWQGEHQQAWLRPQPFASWTVAVPAGVRRLRIEVGWNPVDWEVFVAGDGLGHQGIVHGPAAEDGRTATLRPWRAPHWNQITAGYAIACGMLDHDEALPVLRGCLRDTYCVPWLKRTTPIIASESDDAALIAERAVLCNTPQSLQFFCRALAAHGLRDEAAALCRRLYAPQVEAGHTTLWEEFAPRSSLCHAWAAQCVEWLLPPA